jgi:hypothetical protein
MLADEEGLVVHTADLDETTLGSRTEGFFGLNLLQDRRPDLYGPITETGLYAPTDRPAPRAAAE